MEKEMDKLEFSGWEVDALRGLLGEVLASRFDSALSSAYEKLLEGSAVGKVVTISLSKEYVFEGNFLVDYLEQLNDYPDTPSQREWFVMDRFIGEEALSKLDKGYVMKVEEK